MTWRSLRVMAEVQLRLYLREREAVLWTFAIPIGILLLLTAMWGNETPAPGQLPYSAYLVPGLVALASTSAGLVTLATSLGYNRQNGSLRRFQASPMQKWVYLAGFGTAAAILMLLAGVAIIVTGVVTGRVALPKSIGAVLAVMVIGTVGTCTLGLLIGGLARSGKSANMASMGVYYPLMFLGDAWFSLDGMPGWLTRVAHFTPLNAFSRSLRAVYFGSALTSVRFELGVLLAYALVGGLLAVLMFRWSAE